MNYDDKSNYEKEILRYSKVLELALKGFSGSDLIIMNIWLKYANKNIFKNKELVKLIALKMPSSLNDVPEEILSDYNLIKEIALLEGIDYDKVINYIPLDLIDEFTDIYCEHNNIVDKDVLDEINEKKEKAIETIRVFEFVNNKLNILKSTKIHVLYNGDLVSEHSEEELIDVKEILKDDKFFENALTILSKDDLSTIRTWLIYADKNIFKNKELVKLIALKIPSSLNDVPEEIRSDYNLIKEIALLEGIDYYKVIDYIPLDLIDTFTDIYCEHKHIADKDTLDEINETKDKTIENSKYWKTFRFVNDKLNILKNSKIHVLYNGDLVSEHSEEELIEVKEILKDDKFFENALIILSKDDLSIIRTWLIYADKNIFKNKELVKLIALKMPVSLNNVPEEILSDNNLIRDIASLDGISYDNVIDYIPQDFIDEFKKTYNRKNNEINYNEEVRRIK